MIDVRKVACEVGTFEHHTSRIKWTFFVSMDVGFPPRTRASRLTTVDRLASLSNENRSNIPMSTNIPMIGRETPTTLAAAT